MRGCGIRMLALLLAAILALSQGAALAEEAEPGESTADIEESLQTMEYDETVTRLQRDVDALVAMMESEKFKEIFSIQEVYGVTTEALVAVTKWLLENREVTMKILTALEVGEKEQRLISVIWDSMDRIQSILKEYARTEDGQRLAQACQDLGDSPALRQSFNDLNALGRQEDFREVTTALMGIGLEKDVFRDSEALRLALDEMDIRSEEIHVYLLQLLEVVGESDWAKNSFPALIKEPALHDFLLEMSIMLSGETGTQVGEELFHLASNEIVIDYVAGLGQALIRLIPDSDSEPATETAQTEN